MQISQVMMSSSHTILIKYDEERYLSQFVSEMFYSWQKDSIKCTLQY